MHRPGNYAIIRVEVRNVYFDTHAHYDDRAFDDDRDQLLQDVHDAGVELIVDPGCDLKSSRAALSLAERFPFVYAAVGIHPEELQDSTPETLAEIGELAENPRCAAIGEIGLDYYWDAGHKEEQKLLFRRQLQLALELDKPVVIHDREAHGDCFAIVRDYPGLRGVFHCYSGSAEMARELLKDGWYLGFDGPVTYKNARKTLEVLAICPLERILIETDSPYLSPVPHRGKRNDSRNLRYIVQTIAEQRGLAPETVAELTLNNGKRLFGIR